MMFVIFSDFGVGLPKSASKYKLSDMPEKFFTCISNYNVFISLKHVQIRRGDRGSGPHPLENYKNLGFLSNTGPEPLKITKLPFQLSMLGHHRPASETPFK